jgi:hypothetical protein
MHCPKCDADISDTYQPAEPDVGINGDGWYCDACDLFVEKEYEYTEGDIQLFGTTSDVVPIGRPCACGAMYEMGYGLAGGNGIGPYMFCPVCLTVDEKGTDRL